MQTPAKKLYRIEEEGMIGGVCAGLGAYFNVDPVIIRALFVLLVFADGIGIIIYLVLWVLLPTLSQEKPPHNNIHDIGTS